MLTGVVTVGVVAGGAVVPDADVPDLPAVPDEVDTITAALLGPPSIVWIILFAVEAFFASSWRLSLYTVLAFGLVRWLGLWVETMETLGLVAVAATLAALIGLPLGIWAARSHTVRVVLRPILDWIQTTPAFVYLIPAVFFFGVGVVPGVVATTIFAIPPGVRLTALGIRQVDVKAVEAAAAFGASPRQILREVQIPLALPSIMAGVNRSGAARPEEADPSVHSQTREAAVRLQRAVLPDTLPRVPGWESASFYSPSGRTEVGGDFYDVLPVEGGLAFFVGDVMGRGVRAAASMAQMRAAVRSYVALDPSPEGVVGNLDTMFEKYEFAQLVTLVYVVADASRDELLVVNAGHPPPVVLRADATVETVSEPVTAPLGLGLGRQKRAAFRVPFGESDTVLLYTDGLIERRGEDIDVGQKWLATACPTLTDGDLDTCLAALVESVRDHTREDDVAALAVRRLPSV